MTARDAAAILECSVSVVYALCSQGRLAHWRIGAGGRGGIRLDRADVEDYKRRCRTEAVEREDEPRPARATSRRLVVPDWLGSVERRRKGRA